MTSTKTIVITLPRHLNPAGGRVMVPATSPAATTISSSDLSSLLAGNCVQMIKHEPRDGIMEDDENKPPRKRQRLDHLSMEEKLMRRKLKNRVAAQTARDRKKLRMDQLEAELTDLKEHISELTSLTSILSDQNAKLSEDNVDLQEKLERCTCGGRNITDNQDSSKTQGAEVAEGIMVPVSAPTTGSAAGSRSIGSNQDHGPLYTLLSVDELSCHGRTEEQNGASLVRVQNITDEATGTQPASQEKASCQPVVGSSSAVMESNWDVDHDYSREPLPLDCNLRLTPDEESLITELTSALSEVPVTSNGTNGQETTDYTTNSLDDCNQIGDITTPDILKEFFDFGMDVNVAEENELSLDNVVNEREDTVESRVPVPSPISKEQILDFLDSKTSSSPKYGSESGYESSLSPRSFKSAEESDDQGMELDSFIELFPSLF